MRFIFVVFVFLYGCSSLEDGTCNNSTCQEASREVTGEPSSEASKPDGSDHKVDKKPECTRNEDCSFRQSCQGGVCVNIQICSCSNDDVCGMNGVCRDCACVPRRP